jgi:hypothetical protein
VPRFRAPHGSPRRCSACPCGCRTAAPSSPRPPLAAHTGAPCRSQGRSAGTPRTGGTRETDRGDDRPLAERGGTTRAGRARDGRARRGARTRRTARQRGARVRRARARAKDRDRPRHRARRRVPRRSCASTASRSTRRGAPRILRPTMATARTTHFDGGGSAMRGRLSTAVASRRRSRSCGGACAPWASPMALSRS